MILRKLEIKDAETMLEWMHDWEIVKDLQTDFGKFDIEDCKKFIENSWSDDVNKHYAITDSEDNYLGTISLKNINFSTLTAEFAIVIRKCAMKTGVAKEAMRLIIQKGQEEFGLKVIYWCVSSNNIRANSFYVKNHYTQIDIKEYIDKIPGYSDKQVKEYLWYGVKR